VFPAKSLFVAIVYAKCMEKYFGVDFYTALDDGDLLTDDKYFTIYSKNKQLYDEILNKINKSDILSYKSTQKTQEYFRKEFLI
jgi:pyruvate/2-oxoacid:ferredoxin oxidoreductase beta subunit